MVKNLKKHIQKIEQFNKDRVTWIKLSIFVITAIVMLIADWMLFDFGKFYWILVLFGFSISVVWWYWTMKLFKELINNRMSEIEILSEIIKDIQEIKQDVKKLDQGP